MAFRPSDPSILHSHRLFRLNVYRSAGCVDPFQLVRTFLKHLPNIEVAMNDGLDLSSHGGNSEQQLCNFGACWGGKKYGTGRRGAHATTTMTMTANGSLDDMDLQRPQAPTSSPPVHGPTPETTGVIVARELLKLSLNDRNRVYEEVHAVEVDTSDIQYPPEKLDELFLEIEKELSSVSEDTAFAKAKRLDPDYVSQKDLYLKFLIAETFCPKGAASRMRSYFEYKLELFGPERLTKDIRIQDLLVDPMDRETLESGLFQILSLRDRAGRLVIAKVHKHTFGHLPLLCRLRVFFYLLMTTTEEKSDRQRGIVIVVDNQASVVDRRDAWRNTTLLGALPVKVKAFHVCHNDPNVTAVANLVMLAMGPEYRARFRCHEGSFFGTCWGSKNSHCSFDSPAVLLVTFECISGSITENNYALSSFGIPSHCIRADPISGDISPEVWRCWIQQREMAESGSSPRQPRVLVSRRVASPSCPTDIDIILGRGKGIQNHAGNIQLRKIVDAHLDAYDNAKLVQKAELTERIANEIYVSGGRFLRMIDQVWEEVDDSTAREKISHTFRDRRRNCKINPK